ncbi:NADPH oxidase 5, partial [Camelus dromedarius]
AASAKEDAKWLQWVTRQFEMIAAQSFFVERFFALFDSDGSGTILLQELWRALTHGSPGGKPGFLFQLGRDGLMGLTEAGTGLVLLSWVLYVRGSRSIDADELRTVLQSCLQESAVSMPAERLDQLTLVLLPSAHRDCSGAITFGELRAELQGSPGGALSPSAAHWLTPPTARPRQRRPRPLTSAYWHNHRSHLLCLVVHAGLPLLLLALAASAHRALGASVMVAKGCGQCFNFDCSFIAVLVLRRCPMWLAQALPLDHNVQFHRLTGCVVVRLCPVHTVAHVVNFGSVSSLISHGEGGLDITGLHGLEL